MNRIKYIVVLLIISLFISGCSVDYKLDMSGETIKEDITIELTKSECNKGSGSCEEYARNLLNSVIETEDYPNYSFDYKENGEDITIKLSYTYESFDQFVLDNIYNSSYNNVNIDKDTFILSSSAETYEEELNTKYKVTIIPNKEIKRSNADKKEGNKYIWEFNSSDKNKDIKFSYKKASNIGKEINDNREINTLIYILIVVVITAIVGVIIAYYSTKNKRVNKI